MQNKKNLQSFRILVAIPLLLATLFVSLFPAVTALADDQKNGYQADIVYLENMDTGEIVVDKNSQKVTPMASLTKITTAMVVLNNCTNLDRSVTVTQDELNEITDPASCSAGIKAGEVLTIRQLMNILLVKSANECSVILAHEISGSTQAFVSKMNEYARSVGCTNTHYANPHGLTASGHYTTARDLAKLCRAALKNSTFRSIVAQPSYTLAPTNLRAEPTEFHNGNKLLRTDTPYYYEGCKGIKTGYTESAGRCLASYVTRNGRTFLCIVIGGKDSCKADNKYNIPFEDSIKAYNYAFSR